MASLPIGSDSSASERSYIDTLSKDDLLCEMHERYLRQVSESGVPLWVLDMYGFPLHVVQEEE